MLGVRGSFRFPTSNDSLTSGKLADFFLVPSASLSEVYIPQVFSTRTRSEIRLDEARGGEEEGAEHKFRGLALARFQSNPDDTSLREDEALSL
jgi:hypothetical protein